MESDTPLPHDPRKRLVCRKLSEVAITDGETPPCPGGVRANTLRGFERNRDIVSTDNLEGIMACKRCDSDNQSTFNGEVAIHYPGLEGLDKPIVCVFPKLVVCLHCGLTEFTVPESELPLLTQDAPAA